MTTLSQFPKPDAGQYSGRRKLFLVPTFAMYPGGEDEERGLLDRYWSEVRDHVHNLERSLGPVVRVYHESLFADGDDGMRLIEQLNPFGYSFISAMCQSTAELVVTEDRETVEEHFDWQRCLSIGLMSSVVRSTALEGFRDATSRRYEHIAARVDEAIGEGEAGVIFIHEDHGVQFPADLQIFYVAPPALDRLKRWIEDWMRAPVPAPATGEEPEPMDDSEGDVG